MEPTRFVQFVVVYCLQIFTYGAETCLHLGKLWWSRYHIIIETLNMFIIRYIHDDLSGLCNNLHLSCKSIILYAIVFLFSEDNKSKKTKGVRYKKSICRISM